MLTVFVASGVFAPKLQLIVVSLLFSIIVLFKQMMQPHTIYYGVKLHYISSHKEALLFWIPAVTQSCFILFYLFSFSLIFAMHSVETGIAQVYEKKG